MQRAPQLPLHVRRKVQPMKVRIHCPKCGRILGDTEKSLDGLWINCPSCREAVKIKITVAEMADYLKEEENDKSK